MPRKLLIIAALAAAFGASASADEVVIQNKMGGKTEVRIQVNMSVVVAGPVDSSEASLKSQENARRMLYATAGQECDLLCSTIASDCRIESIGVNINHNNYGGGRADGYNAQGNFAYRVTLK
jgi:hypothetical protein